MYLEVVLQTGNGSILYTSPELTQEEATAQKTELDTVVGTDGFAKLPWGTFPGSNLFSYRLMDALPA